MKASVFQGLPGRSLCPTTGRVLRQPNPRSLTKGRASAQDSQTEQANLAGSNGAPSGTNALDFDELTELIKMVHETDIVEMELKSNKFSLAVRKKEAIDAESAYHQAQAQASAPQYAAPPQYGPPQPQYPQQPQQQQQQYQQQQSQPQTSSSPAPSASGGSKPSAPAKQDGVEVASPMAGTFYRSPAPGEPPFVRKGDKVTKGQTVAIIEAMKMMNEIEADVSGEVVDFPAENGKPVTIGQALILIKPSG
ncbi:hypothetical protein WJX73_006298 [Symbiochloris irregularis]|uniref:Biotin carboxyl carrier protein of acetyl-CoA carboxylase n=1 Tax=Symbiochloris irregularis TaxID=706552 RepID=A0AAW1PQH1_9CHLO